MMHALLNISSATSVDNIPLVFRAGFVLLLALVMVLMKDDDKGKKMKKFP